jgi:hypothetical protein
MGWVQHNAIIVSDDSCIEGEHKKALEIFKKYPELVTPIFNATIEQFTFMIIPDGSKENRPVSNECDELRDYFIKWLEVESSCDFIEVCFGGDNYKSEVVNCRNEGDWFN